MRKIFKKLIKCPITFQSLIGLCCLKTFRTFIKMKKRSFFLGFFFASTIFWGQQKDTLYLKNGMEHPSLVPLHHFGIFSSRIQANFKKHPTKKSWQFHLNNANIFQPFVEAHLPKDPLIRTQLSNIVWYNRRFTFIDQQTTPSDYMNIVIDAIIKEFRVDYRFEINENQELKLTLRSYLFTDGSYPFSFFTADESIEWFHSNIAGGEDPFGRRYYGLNEMHYTYTDRNGRVLEIKKNAFFIGGLALTHYYYPKLKMNKKHIFINLGSHVGLNFSKFNPSVDVGVSANILKEKKFKNGNELRYGLGVGLLKKNLINFNTVIDLGNNPFLANLEPQVEYTKYTRKKNFHSFGVHYQLQTRYFRKKEASYYRLLGKWKEIHAGWHNGITSLYKNLTAWSFVYTYGTKNYQWSFYLQEDLLVHNAPDVQTGVSLRIPLH